MRARLVGLGLPDKALEIWFARLLRNAFALDTSGMFKPFGEIARATLGVMLAEHHLTVCDDAMTGAIAVFAELPAHPDVAPSFQLLHEVGIRIVALTNGNAENTRKLLKRAELTIGMRQRSSASNCTNLPSSLPMPGMHTALARLD